MITTIRTSIFALALALVPGLAAVPQAAAETTAASTVTKLVTMDAELARCWRQRAVAAMIAVNYLRECIAERRESERELKEALNKGIGVLGTDDPERARLLAVRSVLREFSRFMALLDDGLKDNAPEIALPEAETLVDTTCDLATDPGATPARRNGPEAVAVDGYAGVTLCLPVKPER